MVPAFDPLKWTMASLRFRLADLSNDVDMASILRLTNQYAAMGQAQGKALDAEVVARLPEAMRAHPGLVVLIGETELGDVALATCVLSWSSFRAAPLLNIHDLVVDERARNQGIGQAMLDAVHAEAERRGCAKVTLEVWPGNPAERLYERAGFQFSGKFYSKSCGVM